MTWCAHRKPLAMSPAASTSGSSCQQANRRAGSIDNAASAECFSINNPTIDILSLSTRTPEAVLACYFEFIEIR